MIQNQFIADSPPSYPVSIALSPSEWRMLTYSLCDSGVADGLADNGDTARDLPFWRHREQTLFATLKVGALILQDADDALLAVTAFSESTYFADYAHESAQVQRRDRASAQLLQTKLIGATCQHVRLPAELNY